ncbi:hypothetical protein Syun_020904 [Stephania yunnanensis]|uniref:Uncharacterized protein n=1 Tax=Stephania yunnanensis TaxID=152371 RepID=A0AAP0IGM2_9MAGN
MAISELGKACKYLRSKGSHPYALLIRTMAIPLGQALAHNETIAYRHDAMKDGFNSMAQQAWQGQAFARARLVRASLGTGKVWQGRALTWARFGKGEPWHRHDLAWIGKAKLGMGKARVRQGLGTGIHHDFCMEDMTKVLTVGTRCNARWHEMKQCDW